MITGQQPRATGEKAIDIVLKYLLGVTMEVAKHTPKSPGGAGIIAAAIGVAADALYLRPDYDNDARLTCIEESLQFAGDLSMLAEVMGISAVLIATVPLAAPVAAPVLYVSYEKSVSSANRTLAACRRALDGSHQAERQIPRVPLY